MSRYSDCTILLHGPLFEANLMETLQIIRSWRRIYPEARVIFSASDIERCIPEEELGFWKEKDLEHIERQRQILRKHVGQEVDMLVEAETALSLPPLKFDDKVNNCNKMISSARKGLEAVETEYLVRVRSDCFLHNIHAVEDYLTFYQEQGLKPSVFSEPVAISPLFTINPYLLERMAFHFSDWFHIGRTEDVRKIWDIPNYQYHDAIHFQSFPHADYSFTNERAMRARIAVEQYVTLHLAEEAGFGVPEFFNELGHELDSIRFLRDNFMVVNHAEVGLSMPKYQKAQTSLQTPVQCITHSDWRKIVKDGPEAWETFTKRKQKFIKLYNYMDKKAHHRFWLRSALVQRLAWAFRI